MKLCELHQIVGSTNCNRSGADFSFVARGLSFQILGILRPMVDFFPVLMSDDTAFHHPVVRLSKYLRRCILVTTCQNPTPKCTPKWDPRGSVKNSLPAVCLCCALLHLMESLPDRSF